MRNQLQKFTICCNQLLPHETEYLLKIQRFQDQDRLAILQRIDYNCHQISQFTPYDTGIDKRKYNHLSNWIKTRLEEIDVDEQYDWMINTEQRIMTDSIQMQEEKRLLKMIRNYVHPSYFFTKFYELVEHYRQFLLIRLRYNDHQLADDFLRKYREAYQHAKDVHEKLHVATLDIVAQYSGDARESKQWKTWLNEVFYDEELDGLNRYLALVRLTFISFNYQDYDSLRDNFDYLDRQFSEGKYYSRRLLLNYYSNRLMLHSKFREYDQAIYYGYLSVRNKNYDYVHYVNNLCAVLLRRSRHQEALKLMKSASQEVKATKNFHSRVGFVAFYLEALNRNGLYRNAESYGDSFLKAYQKEILQYRWHLFFSVYFVAILYRGHYQKLLQVARKYKLLIKDENYRNKANYLPTIPLYVKMASYLDGELSRDVLLDLVNSYIVEYEKDADLLKRFQTLLQELKGLVPELGYLSVGAVANSRLNQAM